MIAVVGFSNCFSVDATVVWVAWLLLAWWRYGCMNFPLFVCMRIFVSLLMLSEFVDLLLRVCGMRYVDRNVPVLCMLYALLTLFYFSPSFILHPLLFCTAHRWCLLCVLNAASIFRCIFRCCLLFILFKFCSSRGF